ncbi:probable cardiolipin synthase (CMP-forming) [Oppia nitens]|uniref:probable cardiolipin synthase (CMP-forming) n=1 Tax=Oppia nitens TaxID=1686743 RepID=UPI0023DB97C0|nr:probable cardiolipin synthase (CMP-forming) [Oppia nitens]
MYVKSLFRRTLAMATNVLTTAGHIPRNAAIDSAISKRFMCVRHNCLQLTLDRRSHDNHRNSSLQKSMYPLVTIGVNRWHTSGGQSSDKPNSEDKVFTIPNVLCMTRIAMTPVIGSLVVDQHYTIALSLCAISSITDLLDGYIARRFNSVSKLGTILDPLADKFLVATLTITLTVVHLIPVWLTVLILLRDSLILSLSMYLMHRTLSPPKTLKRLFHISTEMSKELKPTFISKINTGFQFSLVTFALASPVFGYVDHWTLSAFQWATGATTLASGLNYLKKLKH